MQCGILEQLGIGEQQQPKNKNIASPNSNVWEIKRHRAGVILCFPFHTGFIPGYYMPSPYCFLIELYCVSCVFLCCEPILPALNYCNTMSMAPASTCKPPPELASSDFTVILPEMFTTCNSLTTAPDGGTCPPIQVAGSVHAPALAVV